MSAPLVYLFDIDGTLVSSPRGVGRRAFEVACLRAAGIERALREITLHGNTDLRILGEAFALARGRAPTETERGAVLAAYIECLGEELLAEGCIEVLPAVRETLEALEARGALIGLATGNIEAGARLKLGRVGLWERFRFGGFGSDAEDRAEIVRVGIARAAALHGDGPVRPDEVWVVGDTPRDIDAARRAGARSVGVATGPHDVEVLRQAGAERVYATLDGLLASLA